ncbi:MAG: YaiO family outer membrane beta-barrel protein [Ginsengibacter sp.]
MNLKKAFGFISLFTAFFISQSLFAQSSDDLFKEARNAAFEKKDYALATQLSYKALGISPDYSDIRIFLGRIYTWNSKKDSARNCFEQVLNQHPDNEDASAAYTDLEYWNDNSSKALLVCEDGLKFHPESKILLMKKAKCLIDLKRFSQASEVLNELLKKDSKNTEARTELENLKEQQVKNKIGVSYDFVSFDKQYNDPWHLVSVDYTRSTKIGSITGRINYANRFKTNGTQFEIDAYPRISKTFYSYMNAGISDKNGVFPQYRAGFSLYANLPNSFEAEGGFRYLYFDDATWIYTASLGKYFKNYWFNFRTYLTPSSNAVSNSYSFTTRYYFKGTDYFALGLGTGISPDETANNIQLHNLYKLKSYRISADYRKTFNRMNIILFCCSILQQEYLPKEIGNQYLLSLTYQRRF